MSINRKDVDRWKKDTRESVLFYNDWFINFAPKTFNNTRKEVIEKVETYFHDLNYLQSFSHNVLRENPNTLSMLRMMTCPSIAKDRLIGLSDANKSLVSRMEKEKGLSSNMSKEDVDKNLKQIVSVLNNMFDVEILPWLKDSSKPSKKDIEIASLIVADRLSTSIANPLIRNAQEKRQLDRLETFLKARGYVQIPSSTSDWLEFEPGQYGFRFNVKVTKTSKTTTNVPVDIIIKPHQYTTGQFPILIEAKSAGDFTNTNKRRKEEATKFAQLKRTYGDSIQFVLYLCGYFGSDYLGYNAAEGIDWVWEHRTEDFLKILE